MSKHSYFVCQLTSFLIRVNAGSVQTWYLNVDEVDDKAVFIEPTM